MPFLKWMRWFFPCLCAASLTTAFLSVGSALAQNGPADKIPGDERSLGDEQSLPPLPAPFSQFLRDRFLAKPEKKRSGDALGASEKPVGSPPATAGAPARGPSRKSGAAEAEALKKALAPKPSPEDARKQNLDTLFERLHAASNIKDAQQIADSIEHLLQQSPSDTANLLLQRAMASAKAGQIPLALSLLDKIVALEPGWAEAWNQRAMARFVSGDTDGAMEDIGQAVKLEPRHFGALTGMGVILQGEGLDKRALEIFKKALAIFPLEPDIQKLVDKLSLEIDGQDI